MIFAVGGCLACHTGRSLVFVKKKKKFFPENHETAVFSTHNNMLGLPRELQRFVDSQKSNGRLL